MELIHQARKAIEQREIGNAFVTDAVLDTLYTALTAAYVKEHNVKLAQKMRVELNRLAIH